jgi:hypothetical protein
MEKFLPFAEQLMLKASPYLPSEGQLEGFIGDVSGLARDFSGATVRKFVYAHQTVLLFLLALATFVVLLGELLMRTWTALDKSRLRSEAIEQEKNTFNLVKARGDLSRFKFSGAATMVIVKGTTRSPPVPVVYGIDVKGMQVFLKSRRTMRLQNLMHVEALKDQSMFCVSGVAPQDATECIRMLFKTTDAEKAVAAIRTHVRHAQAGPSKNKDRS